jgi:hypothetical protein
MSNNMNQQILTQVSSLSTDQLKNHLINQMCANLEKEDSNIFSHCLESYLMESVMSFSSLLIFRDGYDKQEYLDAIQFFSNSGCEDDLSRQINAINCTATARLKSIVYCILCKLETEKRQK